MEFEAYQHDKTVIKDLQDKLRHFDRYKEEKALNRVLLIKIRKS